MRTTEEIIRYKTVGQVYYYMNDSHYYLSDVEFKYRGLCFISGLQFTPIPGRDILLPFCMGHFSNLPCNVDEDSYLEISMMTKNSQLEYRHPNVTVNLVDFCIDYGWSKHFRTICDSSLLKIEKLY